MKRANYLQKAPLRPATGISDVIQGVIGKMAEHAPDDALRVQETWSGAMAPRDRDRTRVTDCRDHVLCVNVDTPARMYHLKLQSRKILLNLQEDFPDIQRIQFRIGPIDG